mmetsp:Transcript_7448/g.13233  ORF Transcript_7448/g.13233 Transcript_7448/m.13233 type:complete len:155 (-) Transcript_7448:199-663(-)
MWGHHSANRVSDFVRIEFMAPKHGSLGALKLSANHYLYVNEAQQMVVAGQVRIGDKVQIEGGHWATVLKVQFVHERGLYHPHTLHGDILVDGVHVSTFSSILPPWFQHGLLSVFRWMYWLAGNGQCVWYQSIAGILDEGSMLRPYLLQALRFVS